MSERLDFTTLGFRVVGFVIQQQRTRYCILFIAAADLSRVRRTVIRRGSWI